MVSDCGGDALDPASASLFPGSVRWEEGPQGWTQSTRCEEVHTTKQAARPGREAALAGDALVAWALATPSLPVPGDTLSLVEEGTSAGRPQRSRRPLPVSERRSP